MPQSETCIREVDCTTPRMLFLPEPALHRMIDTRATRNSGTPELDRSELRFNC